MHDLGGTPYIVVMRYVVPSDHRLLRWLVRAQFTLRRLVHRGADWTLQRSVMQYHRRCSVGRIHSRRSTWTNLQDCTTLK